MLQKVFGIGLSRTGTLSLSDALSQLGWRTIHFPHDSLTFAELASGRLDLTLFDSYDAVTDTPVVPYYQQLADLFVDSKFIVTHRDPEEWHASCESFWIHDSEDQRDPFHRFINAAVYGVETYERTRFEYVRRRHQQEIRSFFSEQPGRLLELNICAGEGWEKLCPFLGVEHPAKPFPHSNRLRSENS